MQPPLFGQPYKPEYPQRVYIMQARHGHGPEKQTCKGCRHLVKTGGHARDYIKCQLYGLTDGAATDWRVRWPACGAYQL